MGMERGQKRETDKDIKRKKGKRRKIVRKRKIEIMNVKTQSIKHKNRKNSGKSIRKSKGTQVEGKRQGVKERKERKIRKMARMDGIKEGK